MENKNTKSESVIVRISSSNIHTLSNASTDGIFTEIQLSASEISKLSVSELSKFSNSALVSIIRDMSKEGTSSVISLTASQISNISASDVANIPANIKISGNLSQLTSVLEKINQKDIISSSFQLRGDLPIE